MNQRGIYTIMIAGIAVALIAAVGLVNNSALETEKPGYYSNDIVETKKVWQNLRYLVDKKASGFMADEAKSACKKGNPPDYSNVDDQLIDFVENEFSKGYGLGIECTIKSIDTVNNTYFNVELECKKELKLGTETEFLVSYIKKFSLKKSVELNESCQVNVLDADSGLYDIKEFTAS